MNLKKVISYLSCVMVMGFQLSALGADTSNNQGTGESQFLENMIQHHKDGVKMAKMALEKGQSKEVKRVSQKIIKVQNNEISQLQSWKRKWYPEEKMNGDMAKMSMSKMDTSKMESMTGKAFDKSFLQLMVEHHEGAVAMAEGASSDLKHKDVKKFAEMTIKNQNAEILKMKKMESAIH